MKYLIECMDGNGNWVKFNYYEGTLFDVKAKMATIIEKTNFRGYGIWNFSFFGYSSCEHLSRDSS